MKLSEVYSAFKITPSDLENEEDEVRYQDSITREEFTNTIYDLLLQKGGIGCKR